MTVQRRGSTEHPGRRPAAEHDPNRDLLGRLLRANRSIIGDLSLAGRMHDIVDAVRELVGARSVALEVFDNTGRRVARSVADTPGSSIRLVGRPHPIPVGQQFVLTDGGHDIGILYVATEDGLPLSPQLQTLVLSLTATAGAAIQNAQLYEESRQQQDWLRAVAEVSRSLITSPHSQTMDRIAESVLQLADAESVTVVRPEGADRVRVVAGAGLAVNDLIDVSYPRAGSLAGETMTRRRGQIFDDPGRYAEAAVCPRFAATLGTVMAVPLIADSGTSGAVVVGRNAHRPFVNADLELTGNFAGQAAIALELAEARADQDRLRLLRDRDRIARDLHDRVIQRLFATGLELQSIAAAIDSDPGSRLLEAVGNLDETIREIRTTIFALRQQSLATHSSLRGIVLSVVADLAEALPRTPEVIFVGPLDTFSDPKLVDDVEAVVREGLTNIVRHADAQKVSIRVEISGTELEVYLRDDGSGITDNGRRSGLSNLADRAAEYGGTLSIGAPPEGGTTLSWTVPIQP
jgi:signal transduction histidine kinase